MISSLSVGGHLSLSDPPGSKLVDNFEPEHDVPISCGVIYERLRSRSGDLRYPVNTG